jgi:hypothetical protein
MRIWKMLRELRDDAQQRGQLSAAIQAEVKRGELRRFYVKQVETGDAGEFERMSPAAAGGAKRKAGIPPTRSSVQDQETAGECQVHLVIPYPPSRATCIGQHSVQLTG